MTFEGAKACCSSSAPAAAASLTCSSSIRTAVRAAGGCSRRPGSHRREPPARHGMPGTGIVLSTLEAMERTEPVTTDVRDLIIVGSGPAGYTAAVYAARAQLSPLVFEGSQFGGALMTTTEVENYPGFTDGIMGPALMEQMRGQAVRFGAELRSEDVEEMSLEGEVKTVVANGVTYSARAVILAMGAAARYLGVPGEQELLGRGVSACATCDGFFFREHDIAVIGGGDSAMEEATFLTRFARLGHDRPPPRRVPRLPHHARARRRTPKIRWITNAEVTEVLGEGSVKGLRLRDTPHGRGAHARGHRHVRRDRPRPAQRAGPRPGRDRRRGLRAASTPPPRTRTSPACSPAATSSTTPTGRPSRRPVPAVRRPSTPSAGSPRARAQRARGRRLRPGVRRRSPPSSG